MFIQLTLGAIIIAVCVFFQALLFDQIIKQIHWLERILKDKLVAWKSTITAILMLAVVCVLIIQIWAWAIFYYIVAALPDMETCLYFSISSFTTVGFGDIYLGKDWRLISSIEATHGFLAFGWSTAFIFEIISGIYRREQHTL